MGLEYGFRPPVVATENAIEAAEGPLVAADWRAKLLGLEGAYAETTIRGYACDFAAFERWCKRERQTVLPASPETVADFITACAKGCNFPDVTKAPGTGDAPATLVRRLAAIRKVHRLLRLKSPVDDEEVKTALRRAIRKKGRRQRQAHGLNIDLREALIGACSDQSLEGLRDRAIVAVGYDTLCRRSELVAMRICDMTENEDGSVTMIVRRSKADALGDGRTAYLTPRASGLLQEWLDAAGIEEGPLFRSLTRNSSARVNSIPARSAGFSNAWQERPGSKTRSSRNFRAIQCALEQRRTCRALTLESWRLWLRGAGRPLPSFPDTLRRR